MIPFSQAGICATIRLVLERNELILAAQMQDGHLTPTKLMMIDPKTFEPVEIKRKKWSKGRKLDDLIAATICGAVVFDAKHGADAIRITENGELEEIELKLAIVDREIYWINENGTIYSGYGDNENNRTGLRSNVSGGFSHIGDPEAKRRATYLVVIDEDDEAIVGAWRLEPNVVFDCLTQVQGKRLIPLTGDAMLKKSRKRDIKLSTFINKGTQVKTFIKGIGIEGLEAKIRKEARKSPYERGEPAPVRRKKPEIVIDSQHQLPYVGASKETT